MTSNTKTLGILAVSIYDMYILYNMYMCIFGDAGCLSSTIAAGSSHMSLVAMHCSPRLDISSSA